MEFLSSVDWLDLAKTVGYSVAIWFGYGIMILFTLYSATGIASVTAGNKEENLPVIFALTAAVWATFLVIKL